MLPRRWTAAGRCVWTVGMCVATALSCTRSVPSISPPAISVPTNEGVRVSEVARQEKPIAGASVTVGLGGQSPAEPEPLATSAAADEVNVALPQPLVELAPFYSALQELGEKRRRKPVRVMWMGDSHTAADFMTDELRRALSAEVSSGGPGFVRLGVDAYRHSEVRLTASGRWRKAPLLPAQRTRVSDGVFGYGGVRTIPLSGASVKVKVSSKYSGALRWTLGYRITAGAALSVRVGNQVSSLKERSVSEAEAAEYAAEAAMHSAGGIEYRTFEGRADEEFVVAHLAGSPEVFGVYIETLEPGVVFDTVGINGARAATALAWEPEQFAAAVRFRDIDLLVLAYGTNEVFDNTDPARYRDHIAEIVQLVRRASPAIPCWIVGPPDAATDDGRSRARVSEVTRAQQQAADALGCAFTSAFELMGGESSFGRWMTEHPPLARGDHIHLTVAGYQELGQRLAAELLGEGDPQEPLEGG